MSFIFIDPRRSRKKAKKSGEAQRVLDALDNYLEGNIQEPVKWLVRFWKYQAAAFTYKELRTLVTDEGEPDRMYKTWFQDYSKLLADRITPAWKEAFLAGAHSNPTITDAGFEVNTSATNVREWILERGAELVTNVTEQQVDAIKYVLAESRVARMSTAETAQYIRPIIGLTKPQASANLRYYNSMKERLREDHPRMTDASIEKKARTAAAKYAEKQQRTRAETIARTEAAYAYNYGNDTAIRQAVDQGKIPIMRKIWSTAADGHVCGACEDLEGTEIDMDKEFKVEIGKNVKRTLSASLPPLHPRCKCAVMYEETGEYLSTTGNEASDNPETVKSFEDITEEWRTNYAISVPNVSEAKEYKASDGVVYRVDGINVLHEYTAHEKKVAELLSRATNQPVEMIPVVKGEYKFVKAPDYLLHNSKERWDLKDLTTDNKDSIRNAAHKKKEQANNFIFNVTGSAVKEHVLNQAEKAFDQFNMLFVNQIAVIKDDQILRVLRRK